MAQARRDRCRWLLAVALFARLHDVHAQQLIGYVAVKDAEVTGASEVMEGRAVLMGSVSVTAKDHTASILLSRRGNVSVCQTSVLHLTESKAAEVAAPLLLSLDRGAIEVAMTATAKDVLMTPDLRFAVQTGGVLDLRLRIARNGDTCVENRGAGAPTLTVSDQFSEAMYELRAGQHVLFEHGSLREVVDHERTPCGCPEAGVSAADALLAPGAAHPFPVAVSEGLAPGAPIPQAAAGEVHTQVTDSLRYNAPAADVPEPVASAPASTSTAPVTAPAPRKDVVHVVGRFFRRLFGR